jgi:hypothetical protein
MNTARSCGVAVLAIAAVGLAGCGLAERADPGPARVASVQTTDDGDPAVITLSAAAEKRLGLRTAAVTTSSGGLVVPYSAVVYEADGTSWAFVCTAPLTYQREALAIRGISGEQAMLSRGPALGALVVTVGAPELVGVEIGIDGEE